MVPRWQWPPDRYHGPMHEFEIPAEVLEDGPRFLDWQRRFVRAYEDLAQGDVDLHDLADRAYLVYPKYRGRDPVEVARELHVAGLPW